MSKPIIIITAGRHNLSAQSSGTQAVLAGVPSTYVKSVLSSGGVPLLLPYLSDRDSVHAALESAHGLLLTGGGDVVSLAYGEEPHPKSTYQDPIRDEMELEATRIAIEMGLPILGICRGIQLLNVALGGTLVQDIPSQLPDSINHSAQSIAPVLLHSVDVDEGSLLARILGTTSLSVNSHHHQSVKDLGKELCVSCRAKDGVIEGIESSEGRPIIGVQFHPEAIAQEYPVFQSLFDWLVKESGE